MEIPRRIYRGGKQVGYYVGPREYEPEDDGVCIRMTAVICITDDHYAGNCRVCGNTLPRGLERVVCLNCLGEQSGFALVEVSNSGNLLEYLLWKQQQAFDRYSIAGGAPEWSPSEQSISDSEKATADMGDNIKSGKTRPPGLSTFTNDEWKHIMDAYRQRDKEAT